MMSATVSEMTTRVAAAALGIKPRLAVLREARLRLAAGARELVDAMPAELARTRADSLAAEVLPLLEACRFLEREAARILAPRRLGRRGLPFWLAGVESRVERVPLGRVLVIGASNYPLFLAGVQTLQALAAGNSVVWKPGRGGEPVARVFARMLEEAGLPALMLHVSNDSIEAGVAGIRAGCDKVVFTGGAEAGRAVAMEAAKKGTPIVAELSGCEAVWVLPSANAARVVEALCFGMRLNGSATCMAPRRLMLVGDGPEGLVAALRERFAVMEPVRVPAATVERLREMVDEASALGAEVCGTVSEWMRPVLVMGGHGPMRLDGADVFAPVLRVHRPKVPLEVLLARATGPYGLDNVCEYGLTAAVFGARREAEALGAKLCVGTVLVNDLIVPTADPRVPFGGRRKSGYGVTRGAEGLLEMTAVKTVLVRRGRSTRHYEATGQGHEAMFEGVIAMSHGRGLRARLAGLRGMVTAAKSLGEKR